MVDSGSYRVGCPGCSTTRTLYRKMTEYHDYEYENKYINMCLETEMFMCDSAKPPPQIDKITDLAPLPYGIIILISL